MSELKSAIKSFSLAAILAMAMSVGVSYAHDTFKRDGARQIGNNGFGVRALRRLDLSEEQTEQIKAMFVTVQETIAANQDRVLEMRELSEAGNVNQAAEIAAELAREKVVRNAETKQNIEALLTADQLAELDSMKDEDKHRGKGRSSRRSRN